MNKYIKIAGAIVICTILFFTVYKILFSTPASDREVVKFVKGMNGTCPSMVDPETRLDKVFTFNKNNLQFNYTLIHTLRDSLPIPALKKYMEPVILEKIKNSGTLRKFLNKKLTWIYSYVDRNGEFIFKVTYTPDRFK